MDMFIENPGLCHIGGKIFKNLDFPTKLNCRLVRKSWNIMLEKQASKIDLVNVPQLSQFLEEKPMWRKFLEEPKCEIPFLVLLSYLFIRVIGSLSKEYEHRTPLLAFARTGNSKIIKCILRMKTITIEDSEYNEALNIAASLGHVNVVKRLRAYRNDTSIEIASFFGHLEVLKVLIDPNSRDLEHFVNHGTIGLAGKES